MSMKHVMTRFGFLFLMFVLGGCTMTNTTGYVDPSYMHNPICLSNVIVRATGGTLEETLAAERTLWEGFSNHNVRVIRYTDIVPPTRNYTPQEETALLRQQTSSSHLFTINIVGKDKAENYVPPTHHPSVTTTHVDKKGRVTTETTSGYTRDGYMQTEMTMVTLATLVDLGNGREMWRAEGRSQGDTTYPELLVSASESAIEDLASKSLIPPERD